MADQLKIKQEYVIAALSYVFVLFLIPMAKKDSPFCQFHAKQGMILFLVWVLVSLVAWLPLVGWIAWLSMLIINVMAIVKTLHGEMWKIPYLYRFAEKINW